MEKKLLFLKVTNIIKKVANDEDAVYELSTPVDELELNSIDFIKLLVFLEDEFNVEFDDEDLTLEQYNDLGDIISTINKMLN